MATEVATQPRFRQTSNLSSKQKDDINFAIIEYLMKYKFEQSIAAFGQEAGINYDEYLKNATQPSSLLKDVLERKWHSIARLKKQVLELEKNCKQLREINEQNQIDMQNMEREFKENGSISRTKASAPGEGDNAKSTGDAVPREPQKLKMMGHRARVTRVIFHPVYDQLATSSEDASIKIWNYETGEVEQTLREHTGMVNYISFSPDGQNMASCARDMTIKLWKLNKEQEFRCFKTLQGHDHEVSCVEYLKPTGDFIMSCSRDQTIRFWDANTGFLLWTISQHTEWVRRLAQSSDGNMMASASKDETVIIWNMDRIRQNLGKNTGDPSDFIMTIIDDHEHVIDCIKFAPVAACQVIMKADYNKGGFGGGTANESKDIAEDSTGDQTRDKDMFDEGDSQIQDKSLSRVDDEESQVDEKKRLTAKERVANLKKQLELKKKMLRGEIVDDKLEEEKQQEEEEDPDNSIQIDTSKQEQAEKQEIINVRDFIATGSRDKKIRIFEVKSGKCVVILAGHDNWITDLYFHPNGKYLISTADDKSIRMWDLAMGRCYRKIYNAHDHFISCFDMKGKHAATGSVDTSVKIWQCR